MRNVSKIIIASQYSTSESSCDERYSSLQRYKIKQDQQACIDYYDNMIQSCL